MKKILTATALALTLATSAQASSPWTFFVEFRDGARSYLNWKSVTINRPAQTRSIWTKIVQPDGGFSIVRQEFYCPTRQYRFAEWHDYDHGGYSVPNYTNNPMTWNYAVPESNFDYVAWRVCSM